MLEFCKISSLKVNLEKSRAFAGKRIPRSRVQRLAGLMEIHFTGHLDWYLGFPLIEGHVTRDTYARVVELVNSKLTFWKGQLLNRASRVTLVNAVVSSIPMYTMKVCWMPKNIRDYLDRVAREFIWKGGGSTGLHLVGWNKITKSKSNGGFGVRFAQLQNVAMLGKLIWDLLRGNKLWVSVLLQKYVNEANVFQACGRRGLPIWNAIVKAMKWLANGFHMRLGNGASNLWGVSWLSTIPLGVRMPWVHINDSALSIADICINDTWRLDILYTIIPQEIREEMEAIQP
ncbi:hypothetical protein Fmac_018913 [Flemingia macrophylla]|uniref:Uncharacterized protein n=1 Tax=Flemingia macrophylla TaxID=520843 RepID=A0ABD1M6A3_9FABA